MRITILISLIFLISCQSNKDQSLANNMIDNSTNDESNESKELKLVWEDNFNEEELNMENWNFELGDGCPDLCGWGNNELQIYTDKNHSIEDGILTISIKKEETYTSTRITTKDKRQFTYGKIEASLKLPVGQGIWAAFWMLGADIDTNIWPDCGEIDIMEYVGKNKGEIFTTLHSRSSFGNSENSKITTIPNIEDDYHVYSLVWDAYGINFFIDQVNVYSYLPPNKNNDVWPFKNPFFIILNTAVGGNFGGPVGLDTIFPQEYKIDYVRVYQ